METLKVSIWENINEDRLAPYSLGKLIEWKRPLSEISHIGESEVTLPTR
jgi:hypothetical protein